MTSFVMVLGFAVGFAPAGRVFGSLSLAEVALGVGGAP